MIAGRSVDRAVDRLLIKTREVEAKVRTRLGGMHYSMRQIQCLTSPLTFLVRVGVEGDCVGIEL